MRGVGLIGMLALSLGAYGQAGRFPAEFVAPPLYVQGLDAERAGDVARAVRFYTTAAERGVASAALRLAEIYESGAPGVPRNLGEAQRWRHAATLLADRPDAQATFVRGIEAERAGRGAEAVRLYIRAARGGDASAAVRLAEIYDKGIDGVTRDYAESLKWRNAARVLGANMIGDFPTRMERERDQRAP